MKRFKLYGFLLLAFLIFPLGINAQKPNESGAKAMDLIARGNFRGAISVLDEAIKKDEDLFASYRLRGILKRMTGDFAGAFKDLSNALELKPDDGQLYEQRAVLRQYQGQDSALILKDLDSAIAYGRKIEKVYAMRGNIKIQTGDHDGAIADFETAIGLRPDFAGAYLGLAAVYQINRAEAKAADVLENFIRFFENSGAKTEKVKGQIIVSSSNPIPSDFDKDIKMGESSIIIKDESNDRNSSGLPPSVEEMDKASFELEQTKNTASAYAALADVYFRRKEYKRASELIETALQIDLTEFSAWETRGKIKMINGDYPGAIFDFDRAVFSLAPTAYLERGIAYFLSGKATQAQEDFDKYLEIFPNGKAILDKRLAEAKQLLSQ